MGISEISSRVTAELEQGVSRVDIYKTMASKRPSQAGQIAWCIASVPEDNLRKKYMKHNAVLFLALLGYSVLNLLSGLPIQPDEPTLFLALTTLIPIVFSYFVFKFHGGVYRVAACWFLIDLLETLLVTGVPGMIDAFKILDLFLVIILMLLIGRKVFPNLGILGPKKDDSGQFIL